MAKLSFAHKRPLVMPGVCDAGGCSRGRQKYAGVGWSRQECAERCRIVQEAARGYKRVQNSAQYGLEGCNSQQGVYCVVIRRNVLQGV